MDFSHLCQIGIPIAGLAFPSTKGQQSSGSVLLAPSSVGGVSPSSLPVSQKPVVTRFAPSPTGYLHIGGARTALFCYLYAKRHGGKFKLRIEDTDAERHDEGAVEAIVKGMGWLGCPHDGEIVRQSGNIERHKEVAHQLLASGGAYKCYCSKESLDAMRAEAEKNKIAFRYPGKCRNLGPDFVPPPGVEPVVRVKTPNDAGVTAWDDGVMGRIEIPNKDIDDFIILRGDGTPTYLLAVVVDDHDMEVTQVIRGSDHIPNTARMISIFKNSGWELPGFAHLPLIHGPDGKKLSKRHGATGVEQYEALGYLPEAMRNYLARLSWAHGNDEIFSTEQAIEWFSLSACSRGAPCFDFDKLNQLNQHYIKECDTNRLTDILKKLYPEDVAQIETKLRTERVADLLKVRAKTLVEYRAAMDFILPRRPISVEPAAAKNIASDAARQLLRGLADLLRSHDGEWSPEAIEPLIKAFAGGKGMKLGDVAKPARAALTGAVSSPGLFEVIWVVGKDEAIGRFEDAASGLVAIKETPAPPSAVAGPTPANEPLVATAAPVLPAGDVESQIKAVGDEIRALKAKLKADGLSGKQIDKADEVKALVARLTELKAAPSGVQASSPAPAAAATSSVPSASTAAGGVEAQIKAVGDEIRALKAKLKADGLSGKQIDKTDEVKALVARLTELKAAAN